MSGNIKYCPKCVNNKDVADFNKLNSSKDGLQAWCRLCAHNYRVKHYLENKEYENFRSFDYYNTHKNNYIETNRIRAKKWYFNNKLIAIARIKLWAKNNPEKRMVIRRRYYIKNRTKIFAQIKSRRRNNLQFRLRSIVSKAVWYYLRRNFSSKNSHSAWCHLSYKPGQLKQHLEKQFDQNMSWENYGSYWHIDHIIPQSKLLYDSMEHPNFQKCWDLSNLRPLEKFENLRKGNK